MKYPMRLMGLMAVLVMFGLTSCLGVTGDQAAAPQEDPNPTNTGEALTKTTEAPREKSAETDKEATQPAEEKQVEEKPTARVGLQATDPETVKLASGEIQLVEFFAFW